MFNFSETVQNASIVVAPRTPARAVSRRNLLLTLAAGAATFASAPVFAAKLPPVEVFKDPNCSCCAAWVKHMEAAGFHVKVTMAQDLSATRKRLGMPEKFASCHTAVVAGYLVEGHVPAAEVKRLVATRLNAIGLSVPGMPMGSPGMEVGSRQDPFAVLLIDKSGNGAVFATYPKI